MIRLLHGHVIDVLATLPAGSVHCCVTSPPFWGLRAYGTEPQVWPNPDGTPLCEACEWSGYVTPPKHSDNGWEGSTLGGGKATQGQAQRALTTGAFCAVCGAWRGELGLEPTPDLYVEHLVQMFAGVWRVLRPDAVVFLNLGDSYFGDSPARSKSAEAFSATWDPADSAGRGGNRRSAARCGSLKPKDLCGIPWRVAFALQAAGWYLRAEIIWAKPNPMPESVTDRPTRAHEQVFLLAKQPRYFYDADAVREGLAETTLERNRYPRTFNLGEQGRLKANGSPNTMSDGHESMPNPAGRNRRSVWTIPTHAYPEAHFATFPPTLVEPCVKAGTSERGVCPACLSPWRRVVERETHSMPVEERHGRIGHNGAPPQQSGWFWRAADMKGSRWEPTCACPPADPIPATVLDPFSGAGTTCLVSDRLGRDAIGIDLNEAYCDMAHSRLTEDAGLFADISTEVVAVGGER